MNACSIAMAIVRGWTRLYTWRLPAEARDARRAELESDLWESHLNDRAWQVIGRLVLGMPDDLRWRFASAGPHHPARRTIALGVATGLLLAIAWAGSAFARIDPPSPPAPPNLKWQIKHYPPPPPPPPPPCNPSSMPQFSPCTKIT